jgi:hypothetical protein
LVANGSAGAWDVAVDETITGAEKWFLQIEGPTIYLYLQIEGPQIVEHLLNLLEASGTAPENPRTSENGERASELRVGVFESLPVSLLWDQERNDGWTLLLAGASGSCLRISLSLSDGQHLADALEQVRDDPCDAGLLSPAS